MITLAEYFADPVTGADRRVTHVDEWEPSLIGNATDLLRRTNKLLDAHRKLGNVGEGDPAVTAGWRPPSVNAHTPGAAQHSLHMECKAIDLRDHDGSLWRTLAARPDFLRDNGLWLEAQTPDIPHVHLDIGARGDRPTRTFRA